MTAPRLAVVGAGPVGLEMALAALALGFDVQVYEAGRAGENVRRFREVPLFTPFAMNSTAGTRERLRLAGVALPPGDVLLTGGELADRYLAPVAELPVLRGRIHERCRITAIARSGAGKAGETASPAGSDRARRPFLLRAEGPDGIRFLEASVVVDASGVLGRPGAFGPGGLEARGEGALGDRVDRHLPPTREAARERFAGRRVLLVGSGHSAATALVEFDALDRGGEGPARVHWVHRAPDGGRGRDAGAGPGPFAERPGDPLPARLELARRANAIAAGAAWLERHPGAVIEAAEPGPDGPVEVTLAGPAAGPAAARIQVDRVLSLVGYRPDTGLTRELQIHTCYASEAPMALAAALDRARARDPARAGDCLAQTTHGPETLRTTEPGFFVIGAKSYGRNTDFLLRVGYEQVRDVASLLAPSAVRDPLEAPA
jgi:cation diffusion facilitator CzcD-associated flavoprotein CzcO